jgi:hypothetical protein
MALADDARNPRYIRTVHGVGYAFCGEAIEDAPSPRPEAECPFVYRLVWDGGIVALAEGEYVLGRHSESIVPIEAATVSRRHARRPRQSQRHLRRGRPSRGPHRPRRRGRVQDGLRRPGLPCLPLHRHFRHPRPLRRGLHVWPLEHAVRCTEGADFLARGHEPAQGASRKCAKLLAALVVVVVRARCSGVVRIVPVTRPVACRRSIAWLPRFALTCPAPLISSGGQTNQAPWLECRRGAFPC